MQLFTCAHPQRIYNKYTDSYMVVPCGKCDLCRYHRSCSWVDRLEIERHAHPYCIFFTLTYSDDFVPKYILHDDGVSLVRPDTGELHTFSELGLNNPYMKKSLDYIRSRKYICCMDTFYIQHFIKRLHSRLYYAEKDSPQLQRVRYFINSEYGPTTHRLHHHGVLFFESPWLASNAKEIIASCWRTDNRTQSVPLGRVDVQVVDASSQVPSYVAAYLNGVNHLPSIYQQKPFLPKSIFSKHPSIGSMLYDSQDLREIFNSGSVRIAVPGKDGQSMVYKPLPSSFENRLYPKVKGFCGLSYDALVTVYGFLQKCDFFVYDWQSFRSALEEYCKSKIDEKGYKVDRIAGLQLYFENILRVESSVKRLYCILNRVDNLCYQFNINTKDYVRRLMKYYSDKDYANLCEQMNMEIEHCKISDSKYLIWLDPDYVRMISESQDLSYNDRLILKSYGFTEYSLSHFRDYCSMSDCELYQHVVSKATEIVSNNKKTKAKNEYLAHRDISKLRFIYGES